MCWWRDRPYSRAASPMPTAPISRRSAMRRRWRAARPHNSHVNLGWINESGTMPRCPNSSRHELMNRFGIAIMLVLALVAGAAEARAGDGSAIHVLGFSADGGFFAFEQYGEQDGSGTLHSENPGIGDNGGRRGEGMAGI